MPELKKPGPLPWILLILWPIFSIVVLFAFYSNGPPYRYGESFDNMVLIKYVLTIIGHVLAFSVIPVLVLVITSIRNVKSQGLFVTFIVSMVVVFGMQCLFRSISVSCIGEGCYSENLPEEFHNTLTYLTATILLIESIVFGLLTKNKLI